MDWNAIVIGLLSTTSLGGIFSALVFFRQNKALKKNEVKNSDTEAQEKQIDLGVKYQTQMLELLDKVSAKQDTAASNQKEMLAKIDRLDEREDKTERQMANIVAYLNGDYQKFLDRQYRKPKTKKETAK